MDINLTLEQFDDLMKDINVRSDGTTNKKCPICGNDVIVKQISSISTLKCKGKECFTVVFRGI